MDKEKQGVHRYCTPWHYGKPYLFIHVVYYVHSGRSSDMIAVNELIDLGFRHDIDCWKLDTPIGTLQVWDGGVEVISSGKTIPFPRIRTIENLIKLIDVLELAGEWPALATVNPFSEPINN